MNNHITGKDYEILVENLLIDYSPYTIDRQVAMGKKPNGRTKHRVDIFVRETKEVLSLKYQSVIGTAEEKIPYEVLVLQHLVNENRCNSATIVLAGEDEVWTQRNWYLEENFCAKMNCPDVRIISHETFLEEYTGKEKVENKGLFSV
tara:strand:- start:14231 stop:14671 length:441 start_codon:yes stop_codon:yes gene_type:complete